jgi:hypothetical protein
MNTHPLEVIERLIDVELRTRTYTRDEFENSFMPTLIKELDEQFWGPVYPVGFETHFPLYQHSLLRLMDTVVNYLLVEEQLCDCYKAIFSCLQKKMLSMLEPYGDYMDIDYQIPSFYFGIDEDNIKDDLRFIRDKLSDAGIDGVYWGIFRQTFHVLFSANSRISYRQFSYLKILREELKGLLSKNKDVSPEELQSHLIYLNFNDTRYVRYVTDLIRKETDEISAINERLMRLYYWHKIVKQAPEQTGISYLPSQSSLKTQIAHWIDEKITLPQIKY